MKSMMNFTYGVQTRIFLNGLPVNGRMVISGGREVTWVGNLSVISVTSNISVISSSLATFWSQYACKYG